MLRICYGFIETLGHYRGKDAEVLKRAEDALRDSKFGSWAVRQVVLEHAEITTSHVEHWGWSFQCASHCTHKKATYGVKRWFGYLLVLEAPEPVVVYPGDILKTYHLADDAQFVLCGEITSTQLGQTARITASPVEQAEED